MRKGLEIAQGTKFDRLTTIEETEPRFYSNRKERRFLCECTCGERCVVALGFLRTGRVKSCGCLRMNRHGSTEHPLYQRCIAAINRCHNPRDKNFERYGGRGIKVLDSWIHNVGEFIVYLERLSGANNPNLSIDRINNDYGYVPGNLRFASGGQQQRNQKVRGEIPLLGVHRSGKRYRSQIRAAGRSKHLGIFDTPEEAAEAYQKALKTLPKTEK